METTVPRPLHPEMQQVVDARAKNYVPAKDVHERRRNWTAYCKSLGAPVPASIEAHDRTVPTREHDVPVRVYRPAGAAAALPCVIYMHGGGFMLGDLDSSDTIAWGLCEGTGACVVSIDYRLTPEHPYPAAFNDCYGVLEWLATEANAAGLGIDPANIAVSGDSAGGNLSAALSLAARDRGGPRITAQAVLYPGMCEPPTTGSYLQYANSPTLLTTHIVEFYELYVSNGKYASDPYAVPTRAADFADLPPALVHVGECDPVRDDGRLYAAKLALAGTPVTFREAKGLAHGFLRARLTGPYIAAEFAAITDFLSARLAG